MFIVWGKKHVYRKIGFISDFCPLCRDITMFRIDRLGIAGHLYYISVGQGEFVGHIKKCLGCKTSLNGNPDIYREISKKRLEPSELQRLTFPNIQTHYAERLKLEQMLRHSPSSVPSDTRSALIKEPFQLLNPSVEKRFSAMQIDVETALTLMSAVVLVPTFWALCNHFIPAYEGAFLSVLLLIGIGAVTAQGFLQTGRYFNNKVFPVLVPALKPLRPTAVEITAVIAELKKADLKFGKKLKQKALVDRLNS